MHRLLSFTFLLLAVSTLLKLDGPSPVRAELYRYTDEHGVVHITDAPPSLPEGDSVQVIKQKQDKLSTEEKDALREQRRLEAEARRQRLEEELRRIEQEERQRELLEQRTKAQKRMQTEVEVRGNKVLVPVTLTYNGREVTASLLLDTGASLTIIHRPIADQLNLLEETEARGRVVGGSSLRIGIGRVSSFQVGPYTANRFPVGVIDHEGPEPGFDGLLGMNFLGQIQYTIDLEQELIKWQ